jgi:hypothetical protein
MMAGPGRHAPEAVVIAWAGGLAHTRQVERALGILPATRHDDDPDVRRWEALEATHRIRADLSAGCQLPWVQCELVAALEALGDGSAAMRRVVRRAVDGPGADIRLQNILLEAALAWRL